MAGKKKIDLADIPNFIEKEDHETVQIIDSPDTLNVFVKKLRKDWYKEEKLAIKLNLFERAQQWFATSTPSRPAFYVAIDNPDELLRNDDWGWVTLYECTARKQGKKIVAHKKEVESFYH